MALRTRSGHEEGAERAARARAAHGAGQDAGAASYLGGRPPPGTGDFTDPSTSGSNTIRMVGFAGSVLDGLTSGAKGAYAKVRERFGKNQQLEAYFDAAGEFLPTVSIESILSNLDESERSALARSIQLDHSIPRAVKLSLAENHPELFPNFRTGRSYGVEEIAVILTKLFDMEITTQVLELEGHEKVQSFLDFIATTRLPEDSYERLFLYQLVIRKNKVTNLDEANAVFNSRGTELQRVLGEHEAKEVVVSFKASVPEADLGKTGENNARKVYLYAKILRATSDPDKVPEYVNEVLATTHPLLEKSMFFTQLFANGAARGCQLLIGLAVLEITNASFIRNFVNHHAEKFLKELRDHDTSKGKKEYSKFVAQLAASSISDLEGLKAKVSEVYGDLRDDNPKRDIESAITNLEEILKLRPRETAVVDKYKNQLRTVCGEVEVDVSDLDSVVAEILDFLPKDASVDAIASADRQGFEGHVIRTFQLFRTELKRRKSADELGIVETNPFAVFAAVKRHIEAETEALSAAERQKKDEVTAHKAFLGWKEARDQFSWYIKFGRWAKGLVVDDFSRQNPGLHAQCRGTGHLPDGDECVGCKGTGKTPAIPTRLVEGTGRRMRRSRYGIYSAIAITGYALLFGSYVPLLGYLERIPYVGKVVPFQNREFAGHGYFGRKALAKKVDAEVKARVGEWEKKPIVKMFRKLAGSEWSLFLDQNPEVAAFVYQRLISTAKTPTKQGVMEALAEIDIQTKREAIGFLKSVQGMHLNERLPYVSAIERGYNTRVAEISEAVTELRKTLSYATPEELSDALSALFGFTSNTTLKKVLSDLSGNTDLDLDGYKREIVAKIQRLELAASPVSASLEENIVLDIYSESGSDISDEKLDAVLKLRVGTIEKEIEVMEDRLRRWADDARSSAKDAISSGKVPSMEERLNDVRACYTCGLEEAQGMVKKEIEVRHSQLSKSSPVRRFISLAQEHKLPLPEDQKVQVHLFFHLLSVQGTDSYPDTFDEARAVLADHETKRATYAQETVLSATAALTHTTRSEVDLTTTERVIASQGLRFSLGSRDDERNAGDQRMFENIGIQPPTANVPEPAAAEAKGPVSNVSRQDQGLVDDFLAFVNSGDQQFQVIDSKAFLGDGRRKKLRDAYDAAVTESSDDWAKNEKWTRACTAVFVEAKGKQVTDAEGK